MKINKKLATLATTAAIALSGLAIAPSATAAEVPATASASAVTPRLRSCPDGQTVHIVTRTTGTGTVTVGWNPGGGRVSHSVSGTNTPRVTFTGQRTINSTSVGVSSGVQLLAEELQCHGI